MAKGEIAHHEQFHLWPQCFQKSSAGGKGLTIKGFEKYARLSVSSEGTQIRTDLKPFQKLLSNVKDIILYSMYNIY